MPKFFVAATVFMSAAALVLPDVAIGEPDAKPTWAQLRAEMAKRIPKAPATRGRSKDASGTASYTVTDYGNPAANDGAAFTGSSEPTQLNNTGQILGAGNGARTVGTQNPQECILYTGPGTAQFVDVDSVSSEGIHELSNCFGNALSDADPKKNSLQVLGQAGDVDEPELPFLATVSLKSMKTTMKLDKNAGYGGFLGFGPGGMLVAHGYYVPDHATSYASNFEVPMVTSANPGKLALLQPACDSAGYSNCISEVTSVSSSGILGMQVNGYSLFLSGGTVYTIPATNGSQTISFTKVNAAGHLLGTIEYESGTDNAVIYDPVSGTTTALVPPGCSDSVGTDINATDEVLGSAFLCSGSETSFNWVWTAANGFQDLTDAYVAPSSAFEVSPIKLNDVGQILVAIIVSGTGATDWGVLTPISSSETNVRRRGTPRRAVPTRR
jgi:hypothetical protein